MSLEVVLPAKWLMAERAEDFGLVVDGFGMSFQVFGIEESFRAVLAFVWAQLFRHVLPLVVVAL